MDDVKNQTASEAPETAEVEADTTEQTSQSVNQTAEPTTEVEATQQPFPEKTIPYGRFSEVNKKLKEYQRKVAELEGNRQLEQYDPNDINAILSHPFVQTLLLKQAKQELTDYARQTLDQYPGLHPQVKKAILANARGFVNEETTDIDQAKIDLLDYIESIIEGEQTQTAQPSVSKSFQVAGSNVPTTTIGGVRPAEVAKILAKPLTDWTDEESKVVEDYSKSLPKK